MGTSTEKFMVWLFFVSSILTGLAGYYHLNLGGWSIPFGLLLGAVVFALLIGVTAVAVEKIELLLDAVKNAVKWVFIGFFIGLGLALANWGVNYVFN